MLTGEDKTTIVDEKYKILKLITISGYNKIYLAANIISNKVCVIKMSISRYSNINLGLIESQVKFHKKIKSENVIEFIEEKINGRKRNNTATKFKTCHYIVLEYASKGEMYNYIKLNKGIYFKVALFYFKQLLKGIEDMHNLNVCHRDIKVENLLLDEEFNLKIADFEFSQEIKNVNNEYILHTDKQGTLSYMAPEFFIVRLHNEIDGNSSIVSPPSFKIFHTGDKIDIFAAGVVLFILLTGMFPFHIAEKTDKYYKLIYDGNFSLLWGNKKLKDVRSNIPEHTKDLLNRMFEPNPEKRISIKEIKEHPFYNDALPSKSEVYEYMNNLWLMVDSKAKKQIEI